MTALNVFGLIAIGVLCAWLGDEVSPLDEQRPIKVVARLFLAGVAMLAIVGDGR